MGLNFPNPVNLIPYDAVLDSEYLNAALVELTDRTVRLADYVSNATSGKLLRSEQQLCDVTVAKNDVVYWSIADQRFAKAVSAVYDNAGVLEIANSGLAMGICETKHSASRVCAWRSSIFPTRRAGPMSKSTWQNSSGPELHQ